MLMSRGKDGIPTFLLVTTFTSCEAFGLDQCWTFKQVIVLVLCLSDKAKPWLPLCTLPAMLRLFTVREQTWECSSSFSIIVAFGFWVVVLQVTR
ncbi:hypothetical protein Anapl_12086, partial [Anas platyrhynchos]